MGRRKLAHCLTLVVLLVMVAAWPAAQQQRSVFAILPGYSDGGGAGNYTREMYLPQITNGPNYPTWSPDGRQIAFAMKGSIWRLTLGETTAHEVIHEDGYASQPAWSPDGKWIAYTVESNEQIHLKLFTVQDGTSKRLTSGASINLEPEWSPEGKRLAYVSTAPNGRYNIYVMPLETGVAGPPVMITSDFEHRPPTVYYGTWTTHIHPTWTRDGKELIFVSNRDSTHGSGGFYRVNAEPGAPMKRFYYEETTWKARPTLSPDGTKLVYASYLGRQWHQLWGMSPQGGSVFPLTYGAFDRTSPRWSPDGSRIAFISNETGDTSLWLFHWYGGKLESVKIERLVYAKPMGTLRVRILGQDTGRGPVAARVNLEASDGRSYAPNESWFHTDWNVLDVKSRQQYSYFHSDGEFEVMVPLGPTKIAVSKGLEYLPAQKEITVTGEKPASIEIVLDRLDNLNTKGWWNGNNHLHMNYGGVYRNTPEHLLLQGGAEGLQVLNNLICNKEQRIPDIAYFTGKPDPLSNATQILYHNQEYHPPFWGHAVFLNLKQHYVLPEYVGYPDTMMASQYPTNTTPFKIVRDEGGLAGYAHGAGPHFPVDLALENVDFAEANSKGQMQTFYRAWNNGYRIVASAGEDSFPNFFRTHILGDNRVYVKTGKTLNYEKWIADFRAGRAFVTSGPLVFASVNGKEPGDEIKLSAGRQTLEVRIEAESITPIESVELVYNGEVIETVKPTGKALKAKLEKTVSIDRSGWYAAVVTADGSGHPIRRPEAFAATMPIWVTVDNKAVRSRKDAEYFVDLIDRTLERAMSNPLWNSEQEKEEVRQQYAKARALMKQRANEDLTVR